jgi:tetratricopeptide (TPR) repeat protein
LEAAIRYYLEALKVFTREASPQDWANTRSNLGNAYLYRIQGDKGENLEVAIRCYSEALQVSNRLEFPQDWATIQNNLGNAYCKRIQGDRVENLETAIHCYSEALELLTSETYPQDWAGTQSNLGNAYLYRIRGDRAENIEAAIQHYLAALEVSIREVFPQNWAEIQNNLGGAYLERILGERAENLEAAIGCFLGALEIYTRRAFPQNHAETQFNLGLAYQDTRHFPKAYNAFATAIETVEFLRNEIVSGDEVKEKLAKEWNALYQSMVEVCLEMHDYAKAIEYVERSQALNIVELLAKPDLYPQGSIPPDISNQLDRLRQITTQPQLIDMAVERRRRGILTWESANAGRTKERFLVAS